MLVMNSTFDVRLKRRVGICSLSQFSGTAVTQGSNVGNGQIENTLKILTGRKCCLF